MITKRQVINDILDSVQGINEETGLSARMWYYSKDVGIAVEVFSGKECVLESHYHPELADYQKLHGLLTSILTEHRNLVAA
ncbi:hypothetical protein FVR03_01110 [Pontibacter qinzhouensis]|uniref:Uncharacterized protein n=1 Tax=Pontibacter qinzhouensis TaxID=2603253 RepID=A0A5C8KEW7_9BACT|nr:hypothetical protein [Pontibacter qinzhouensis]TXK52342.1 hypothetical protein FVR03_01110 [Pontibacter qinzhouensis]